MNMIAFGIDEVEGLDERYSYPVKRNDNLFILTNEIYGGATKRYYCFPREYLLVSIRVAVEKYPDGEIYGRYFRTSKGKFNTYYHCLDDSKEVGMFYGFKLVHKYRADHVPGRPIRYRTFHSDLKFMSEDDYINNFLM